MSRSTRRSCPLPARSSSVLSSGLGASFRPLLEELSSREMPAVITVTTAVDTLNPNDGVVSLREAIAAANANSDLGDADIIAQSPGAFGADTINFAIPGAGVQTITLTANLPFLNDGLGVTINGYSQPGASANTLAVGSNAVLLVELNGNNTATGLTITSANNTIQGLVINRMGGGGIGIGGVGASANLIAGNYIGTDATGTAALGNSTNGVYIAGGASNNTVGGTTPGARNVISGNGGNSGIEFNGGNTTGNVVLGNYIGTDASGTADLGNTLDGVLINSAVNNTVGGTAAGARNVISGNNGSGVQVANAGATGNMVLGNYIGTDVTGTADLGNAVNGVTTNNATNNTIGGTTAAARNVISGNDRHGVELAHAGSTGNVVLGNYIGTDVTGTVDLGNTLDGVLINGAVTNTVGGTVAGARNVISGNNGSGVQMGGTGSTGNMVLGNYIGTDVTGTADLGNTLNGFIANNAAGNTVGGTTAAARNVISGNNQYGVEIVGAGSTGNVVLGNYIGTDVNGTDDLGNSSDGVRIHTAAAGNTLGGTAAGSGNVIAFNTGSGVAVGANAADTGATGNLVLGNSISGNGAIGIDLASDGVTPNGANPRALPNTGQNTPVVAAVTTDGTSTTVTGTLTSTPNTTFRVEFFSDPAGGTQGRTFLGFVTVSTDGAGAANFQFTTGALPADVSVTGTATGPGGTSEFFRLVADPTPPPVSPVGGSFVVAPGGGPILLGPVGSPSLVPFADWTGEVRVATGDVTGDGVADLVVGAGPGAGGGHVKVFDGQTRAEVASFLAFDVGFLGGVTVATGDIDGDGFADIIVGAGAGAGGHVKVFSGRDGSLLRSFMAFDTAFLGGVAVSSGDVDGDGRADVLVVSGAATPAHVKAFSGRDNSLLQSFFAFVDFAPALTGPAMIAAGDLDGDRAAEIVVGSGERGTVRVFRGSIRTAEINPFVGYAGSVRVGAFDRDGDGLAELLVGAGPGGPGGHTKILGGQTFAELDSFLPFAPAYTGGVFVG